MSSPRTLSPRGRVLRRALAVLAVPLLAALTFAAPAAADPPPPEPNAMTVVARTDPALAASLSGAPAGALPEVLAAVGTPFEIEIALWNDTAPAWFSHDVTVALGDTGPGELSIGSVVIPAGAPGATLAVSYSAATASVQVTAAIASESLSASSAAFPVDLQLSLLDGQSAALRTGTAGADADGCRVVDAQHPVCGVVALPQGAEGTVALSLGACPAGADCANGALVTQLIADLTAGSADLYSRTAPASMTLICDKTLCGQGGVAHYRARWSTSATGDLITTEACPAKGRIGADQEFCTDRASSTRDKAGDLHLVVLFLHDVRGTI